MANKWEATRILLHAQKKLAITNDKINSEYLAADSTGVCSHANEACKKNPYTSRRHENRNFIFIFSLKQKQTYVKMYRQWNIRLTNFFNSFGDAFFFYHKCRSVARVGCLDREAWSTESRVSEKKKGNFLKIPRSVELVMKIQK